MTPAENLGAFVRAYVERAVNRGDPSAVDDLVAPGYRGSGHGWPEDAAALRAFYERQARVRPHWRIEVQETVEAGDWVAVRALAGDARRQVEWLAAYRVRAGRITEIRVLALVERPPRGGAQDQDVR